MKNYVSCLAALLLATAAQAAPLRVLLLDFEDLTGTSSDALLGGTVEPGSLAAKGVNVLSQELLRHDGFSLVDRRDFTRQLSREPAADNGQPTTARPSFLHAAQTLRADAVLRGSLLSFSTGKQVIDQGGYRTEFSTVTARVSLEALDAVDGSVIAMAEGTARDQFRQTAETHTVLGEDSVVSLLQGAVADAVPDLAAALKKRADQEAARKKVKISITSSADPALVEIDGVLVGSTPLEGFEVYQGDHVLTVGKAGHYDVTKRVLFDKDVAIEVPLIRVQLSADEVKEVLEKARLHIFEGEPGLVIHELHDE